MCNAINAAQNSAIRHGRIQEGVSKVLSKSIQLVRQLELLADSKVSLAVSPVL